MAQILHNSLFLNLNHEMHKSKLLRHKDVLWRHYGKHESKNLLRFWNVTLEHLKTGKLSLDLAHSSFQALCLNAFDLKSI